jgi:hypothetical protein
MASQSASGPYLSSDHLLSAKLVPTFADRVCHVVSARSPHGRNFDFLDRSRYYFFQVAPQLFPRGSVDPVRDPLLLRKSGSAGNRTRDPCICSQKLATRQQGRSFLLYTYVEWYLNYSSYRLLCHQPSAGAEMVPPSLRIADVKALEDEGDMFLRNTDLLWLDYTLLHPYLFTSIYFLRLIWQRCQQQKLYGVQWLYESEYWMDV